MNEKQALSHVRRALADLYDDPGRIRIIASDIGLSIAPIDISGRAETTWQGVLEEARKKHKLEQLIERAQEDYGENEALCSAWDRYKTAKQSKKTPTRTTTPKKSTFLSNFKIPRWRLPRLRRRTWITLIGSIIFGILYAIGSSRQCTVNVDKLDARSGPGNGYALVGIYSKGTKFTPLSHAQDKNNLIWASITEEGKKLWLPLQDEATGNLTVICPEDLKVPPDTSY